MNATHLHWRSEFPEGADEFGTRVGFRQQCRTISSPHQKHRALAATAAVRPREVEAARNWTVSRGPRKADKLTALRAIVWRSHELQYSLRLKHSCLLSCFDDPIVDISHESCCHSFASVVISHRDHGCARIQRSIGIQ